MWRPGVSLLGNELHTDNFHHFNRDMLFFARILAKRLVPVDAISTIVLTDHSEIAEWAVHHARAVLGKELLERVVFLPRRRPHAPSTRRASLVPSPPPWRNVHPLPRHVCFETALEKLVTDPVDRADLAWLRARARGYCGMEAAPAAHPAGIKPAPPLLLLLMRGHTSLGDKLPYDFFWVSLLGLKFWFSYCFQLQPLVQPTRDIWALDLTDWYAP